MKNIFKIFRKKPHITIDCETGGLIPVNDIAGIIRDTKEDFNKLTRILNAMPVNTTNIDEVNPAVRKQREELWEWNVIARTIHHDIGIDIENLERIMNQWIPFLKDAKPTNWILEKAVNELFAREMEKLTE